jgi:hypothetical protein
VLDPTGPRVVLRDLAVTLAADLAVETDGDRGGAGRSLVEAQDDFADVGFQVRFRLPVE